MRTLLASLAAVGMLALLILVGVVYTSTQSNANGGLPHFDCNGGVVDITSPDGHLATYNASPDTITGVCIKAGNNQRHSFFTADALVDNCYAIHGIGSSFVSVTRFGVECQDISHIDVLVASPTPTPTSTPGPTPTPVCEECGTPTPTPTPEPTPTPTPEPTPTPTPKNPTATPTPVADPTPTPTPPVPVTFPDTGGEPTRK